MAEAHDEAQTDRISKRPITRRQMVVGGTAVAALAGLAACGSDDETSSPETTAAGGTDTTAGGGTDTTAGGTDTTAGEGKTGGTLRVAVVGSTNDIIDGQFIVAKPDQIRLVLGWEPLVNYDENFDISYEHTLAENVEAVAADHYIITLKEGINFHNGNPVTADDVIYSFERRLDPDLGIAPALSTLLDISGVTKVDDRTIDIKLLQPAVTFLNGLAEYTATIVPKGYSRDDAEQIGTGPYMLKSFTPGAESVHVRYDGYWGGRRAARRDAGHRLRRRRRARSTRSRPARST